VFEEDEDPASKSFFSEIISSISDVRFSNDGMPMPHPRSALPLVKAGESARSGVSNREEFKNENATSFGYTLY
jgi:hypothetical protein